MSQDWGTRAVKQIDRQDKKKMTCRGSSLVPRRSGGGAKEKNAWYTLFAHAPNFRKISENRIFR